MFVGLRECEARSNPWYHAFDPNIIIFCRGGPGVSCCRCRQPAGIMPENVIRQDLSDVYKATLAENYVAQTLHCSGHKLYYWTSASPEAKIDFLVQKEGTVVPIEVKYDVNVHARSMKHFANMYHPESAIRISARNFGADGQGMYSVPQSRILLLMIPEAALLLFTRLCGHNFS